MIDTCPLCGGQTLELALTCKDWYASGETFEVVALCVVGWFWLVDLPHHVDCNANTEVIILHYKDKNSLGLSTQAIFISSTSNTRVEKAGIPAQAFDPYPNS